MVDSKVGQSDCQPTYRCQNERPQSGLSAATSLVVAAVGTSVVAVAFVAVATQSLRGFGYILYVDLRLGEPFFFLG